uniref:Uncharacterized protein n=1 Tax=Micrurus spixii TaxID=129469 RepID=A0A2D4MLY3_9SAUR
MLYMQIKACGPDPPREVLKSGLRGQPRNSKGPACMPLAAKTGHRRPHVTPATHFWPEQPPGQNGAFGCPILSSRALQEAAHPGHWGGGLRFGPVLPVEYCRRPSMSKTECSGAHMPPHAPF